MQLRELYPVIRHSTEDYIIKTIGEPFPKCGYNFEDKGHTCHITYNHNGRAFRWNDFIDRVDTCWQLVGKSEIVSINGNVIIINRTNKKCEEDYR